MRPVPYGQWVALEGDAPVCRFKLSRAGHILGSAFVEFTLREGGRRERVLFSGDLGAPWTPLLPAPRSPYRADVVMLESTYGDRWHDRTATTAYRSPQAKPWPPGTARNNSTHGP